MGATLTATEDAATTAESYRQAIDVLEAELLRLENVFRSLTENEWRMTTKLVPLDTTWTALG